MSEMIVIECDYKDGECLERFAGFVVEITDRAKKEHLNKIGWLIREGKHYCPLHCQEVKP
jgi:hypothetical protein